MGPVGRRCVGARWLAPTYRVIGRRDDAVQVMNVERCASGDLVPTAAMWLEARLRSLTDGGRRCSIAVSGGRTPWEVFALFAQGALPWELIDVFQVDERVAPAGSDERNLTRLDQVWFSRVPVGRHPMPVESPGVSAPDLGAPDLDTAAAAYSVELPGVFDLIHLGLGPDGHCASLVPGDPVLDVTDRDVAVTGVYQGRRRMTLTYPVLNRAAEIVWIVSGDDKSDALAQLLAADPAIPAGRVDPAHATVLTDLPEGP